MIINHFSFEPLLIDSRIFRKGLLLHLEGSNGKQTTVEISPLPGFSIETFQEVKEQLIQIKRRIMTTWWSKPALNLLSKMDLYPSVHFAVETAITDLIDQNEEEDEIQTYSLLFGTPNEILTYADDLEKEGKKEIKVKMGHFNPSTARKIIEKLIGRFHIRFDFNRKWHAEDTSSLFEQFPSESLVYIEEPCQNPSDLLHFSHPFALDETLRDYPYSSLLSSQYLKALILKPTLHYPIYPFLQYGIPCVVTSSFESAVGIGQIKRLIKRYGLEKSHHGLDTLRYFDKCHEMSRRLTANGAR